MTGGDDMLPHLAAAARSARTAAQISTFEIAHHAHVDPATVRRFERARAWPRNPDQLVRAYALCTSHPPRDLWRDALARWNGR